MKNNTIEFLKVLLLFISVIVAIIAMVLFWDLWDVYQAQGYNEACATLINFIKAI